MTMWSVLVIGGALGQPPAPPPSPPLPVSVQPDAPVRGRPAAITTPAQPVPAAETVVVPPPQLATPAPAPPPAAPSAGPDRWPLMRLLQGTWYGAALDDNRLRVSGWTEAAFTASTDRVQQLPLGFNYRANEFTLQQNWLRVERAVDDKAPTPTWGFRSDTILPGIDYRFTIARGLFDRQLTAADGGPNLYGIDPVQFYGELYLPGVGRGTDVKLGRFFAQFGVESIDTTQNPLVSHAYNFLYNPFTHTGLLTTTKLSDAWGVQNGIVAGSDTFVGPEANPTYIGSTKWAPPAGRASVLVAVIVGSGRYNADRSFSNPDVFDLVYTHTFSDRLNYTLDALYSFQTNFPGGAGANGFVNNWGVVQYLTCQFRPALSGTVRLEFFDDPQGFKTGSRGLYTAATTGVTYKPAPYLWLRPEVRYDNNAESRPFEGKPNLFTAALDVIIRW